VPSLYGLLDLGAGALIAQSAGIAAVGRNTSNVNTEGYTRESVLLSANAYSGGVTAGQFTRIDDLLLAARERESDSARAFAGDLAARMSALEASVAPASGSVVDAIAALFGGILDLASAPADPIAREQVVARANDLGASFRQTAGAIQRARSDADLQVVNFSEAATALSHELAALNKSMALDSDPMLADRRDLVARKLSELAGGSARIDPDGAMRFTLENGAVLVDGDRAASIVAVPDAANQGFHRVEIVDGPHRSDATEAFQGGRIGAQLAFRDDSARRAAESLDRVAFDLATQVNAIHRGNEALDGSTGRDLFVEPAQAAGAAAAFGVSADITADPSLLAGAAPGQGPNDGSGFTALAGLRDGSVESAIRSFSTLGLETQRATSSAEFATTRSEMLSNLRTSVSGVSIEEELARLASFQHASEASAKFVGVVDDLLGTLIQTL
jgi:flagellar hook-associated protein 1